ncbi:alpha/beta fold hydrolase [Pimelobacter simplex]|uniref:Alpha/beta fold hydrolase n=1 Tax=Nocardioides simplex TaxID=2045 RepID=A0A7J5DU48_NOCSI|nr:alpha/beta fold hydrolase [Pimelobacter simplex]KAB2808760.1 alpha/beta fold hydrolase [Pimelobacter simplex]
MSRKSPRIIVVVLAVLALVLSACSEDDEKPAAEKSATEKPTAAKPRGLDGDWAGAIEVPGAPLDIGVTFADGGATITIPAQGLDAAELTDVRTTEADVAFAVPQLAPDATFAGTYSAATDRITGKLSTSGQELAVSLERGTVAPLERPQEPKEPFPYRSEDVSFEAGEVTIAGTLTLPEGEGEGEGPYPAVVLLTGAGAQDRDEQGFAHKPFLVLADALTRSGYAVLRTDDRGVGGTAGSDDDATYDDLVADALAMTDFLRERPEIDPERIGLMGHSQGGYLAPLAASRAPEKVAFTVLMAGPAQTGCEVLKYQARAQLELQGQSTPAKLRESDEANQRLCDLLAAGDLDGARALEPTVTPTMAAQTTYDPEPALRALKVPSLAFFGSKDVQVPPSLNEPLMRRFLQENADATVHVFPGANHLMQPAQSGTPDEYAQLTTTIDPDVLAYVTTWLKENVPAR